LPFEGRTGQFNNLTDIAGVEVGFTTLIEGEGELQIGKGPIRTGITVILPYGKQTKPSPVWAGQFSLNGNGEMTGTHWINDAGYFIGPVCITNTHSVGMVHHAVTGWMINQYKDIFIEDHGWALPVVAETYDGMTNDICGRHIKEDHVLSAIASAKSGPIEEGNVGGGTGMQTYEFKGGTGSSSRIITIGGKEYTIGALVQSNFGARKDLKILGVPVGKHMPENAVISETVGNETGSIIVIVGTNLPLSPIQLQRIAKRSAIGIGRTGTPGGHYSGDIFLAFSTGNEAEISGISSSQPFLCSMEYINDHYFDDIYDAVVQSVEESVINAMIAAESMNTIKPAGKTLDAIDHEKLKDILKHYNRLNA
jgi:D-aminopeptidase